VSAPRRGRFVVFEGIEGAGKSTQLERVTARLAALGLDPLATCEPGGTELGRTLRRLLLDEPDPARPPLVEALLMTADRADHLARVVRPALAAGRLVLSDRYEDATFAYQGAGSGVPEAALEALSRVATGGLRPDLVIWLDLPVEEAARRLAARGGARDRFEGEERDFFERVRTGYRRRAEREPGRWWILDALADPDALAAEIAERVARLAAPADNQGQGKPLSPPAARRGAGGRRSAL
jgi:dTMP kinase